MVHNYRGVSLLSTAYKIYTAILNEKLKEDLEKKKILSETQAGFRKQRGTIDNVYILQHIVERELTRKGGKVYAFFVDVKSAFDNVNREMGSNGKDWNRHSFNREDKRNLQKHGKNRK